MLEQFQVQKRHIAGNNQIIEIAGFYQAGVNATQRAFAGVDISKHFSVYIVRQVILRLRTDHYYFAGNTGHLANNILDDGAVAKLQRGLCLAQPFAFSSRKHNGGYIIIHTSIVSSGVAISQDLSTYLVGIIRGIGKS